jgi:hypothetical protein
MDVYKAAHRVDITEPVAPPLQAAQPENASEDPVPVGILLAQTRMKTFTGHAPANKDAAFGSAITYLGPHDMAACGSAFTSHLLTRPISGG